MADESQFSDPPDMYDSSTSADEHLFTVHRRVPSIINQQAIYLSIVAILGVIGNLTVILQNFLPKGKPKRHSGNLKMSSAKYFVLSLCLSNLGTLTVSLSFTMLPYYIASFPITQFSCRYILPARELFIAVSIYSVAFIAVDCYLVRFKTFCKRRTRSFYLISVVVQWVVCYLVFALPFAFVYEVRFIDGAYVCDTFWPSIIKRRVYLVFLVTFNVFLPGIVVLLCYVAVIRNLKSIRQRVAASQAPTMSKCPARYIMAKSKKIIRVALMMVTAFVFTCCPFAFLVLVVEFWGQNKFFRHLEVCTAIATCLLFSSAMIFPYILIFTRRSFKVKTDITMRLPTMAYQTNRGFDDGHNEP